MSLTAFHPIGHIQKKILFCETKLIKKKLPTNRTLPYFLTFCNMQYQKRCVGKLMDSYVQEHGRDKLKWSNRGQLLVNGEVISGSHIIDLVRYAVCPKTTCSPVGSDLFFKALRSLDMPMPLIATVRFVNHTGEETDHMLQEGSGYIVKKRTSGAPPGYHSPKSKRNKTDSKWLKL